LFAAHAVLNKFSDAARACTGVIAEIRRGTAPSVMATITKVGEIAREANRYAINFCTPNDGRRGVSKPVHAQAGR
jgi:hypothetical protein